MNISSNERNRSSNEISVSTNEIDRSGNEMNRSNNGIKQIINQFKRYQVMLLHVTNNNVTSASPSFLGSVYYHHPGRRVSFDLYSNLTRNWLQCSCLLFSHIIIIISLARDDKILFNDRKTFFDPSVHLAVSQKISPCHTQAVKAPGRQCLSTVIYLRVTNIFN